MKTKKSRAGFTLVEMLIVIGIIGVLAAALGGGAYINSRKRAKDAKAMSELEQLRSELEMIRADEDEYPSSKPGGICDACEYSGGGASYTVSVQLYCDQDSGECGDLGKATYEGSNP